MSCAEVEDTSFTHLCPLCPLLSPACQQLVDLLEVLSFVQWHAVQCPTPALCISKACVPDEVHHIISSLNGQYWSILPLLKLLAPSLLCCLDDMILIGLLASVLRYKNADIAESLVE